MAETTIVDAYSCGSDESKKIKLKISISKSTLKAKSTVKLDETTLGEFDDTFELDLGSIADIKKKVLYVDSTVASIDRNKPAATDFTLELSGGSAPFKASRNKTVDVGQSVAYTAEICFNP